MFGIGRTHFVDLLRMSNETKNEISGILLVEGETEGNYISAYARRLGVLNKISIIKPSGNSPAEMVKEAARILALDELKGTT